MFLQRGIIFWYKFLYTVLPDFQAFNPDEILAAVLKNFIEMGWKRREGKEVA